MTLQSLLGNFALILFILTVATGIIWCFDVFYLAPQRRIRANVALAEFDARTTRLQSDGIKTEDRGRAAIESALLRQPTWIEYSGSFWCWHWCFFCVHFYTNRSRFLQARWCPPWR
jgi:signal peptidase I